MPLVTEKILSLCSGPTGTPKGGYLLLRPLMGRPLMEELSFCNAKSPDINVYFMYLLVKHNPPGPGLRYKIWYLLALKRLEHPASMGCTPICRREMAL